MGRLDGKIALVIGGAAGIGEAVVEAFRKDGAVVIAADLSSAANLDRSIIACDVRKEADVAQAIAGTMDRYGRIDILINNAGLGMLARPFHTVDWNEHNDVIDVNLRGAAFGMRHALPHMIAQRSGRIINTASQLAHKPSPGQAIYCAAKAALVALTASVAQEVAQFGIAVNCVCPGPTDTAMWRQSDPDWINWKLSQLPIGRVAHVDEIAAAYVFLGSDDASYMVGQSVSPNGGDVMW